MATDIPTSVPAISPTPFPARSKRSLGTVGGTRTEVSVTLFSDKILVTITQDGRLAHWVHVPLGSADPNSSERFLNPIGNNASSEDGSHLLPMPHLTATTILGGGISERVTLGELYATQIASAIMTKTPQEGRLLVLGMGFQQANADRETFLEVLDLVLECI